MNMKAGPTFGGHMAASGTRPACMSSRRAEAERARRRRARQIGAVGLRHDSLRREHPRVCAGLRDVVRPQPPIEADRGVQRLEGRVLWLGEARHAGAAAYAALSPSAICATCVASAKPSRCSVTPQPNHAPVPAL